MDNRESVDRSSEEFAAIASVAHGASNTDIGPRTSGDGLQTHPRAVTNESSPAVNGVMQSDVRLQVSHRSRT